MSRRIKRKVVEPSGIEVDVDWTMLPDDTVIQVFSCLNYRDRANLSSTCRAWRSISFSPYLWKSLDLRPHKCDSATASVLASRCANLQTLLFRGTQSANAILSLQARGLRQISGDYCRKLTDATLSVIVARHELLEGLQLGPHFCDKISSEAIKAIAICCPNLRKLRLSGIREIDGDAIDLLAKHCSNLTDVGFVDCRNINEVALGNLKSVHFLSVAGTTNMNWALVADYWTKMPNLKGLDFSRTNIMSGVVIRLCSSLRGLKIVCALNCTVLEKDPSFAVNINNKGKVLIALFNDTFKEVASLFADTVEKERDVFSDWQNSKKKDKNLDEIMTWLEWILSHSLLRIAESNLPGLDYFWLGQGAALLLCLMQSSQEDVQERAVNALATFVVRNDENTSIHVGRAEAVMRDGGIRLLLNLAKSWREGLQAVATKAIANLSVNSEVGKAIAEQGGIAALSNLARSMNKLVAEEAAGALWNLSVGDDHKDAMIKADAVKALVDLIIKWSQTGDGVLERAAGALANLAADETCSTEVANVGGLQALVVLVRKSRYEGVQQQASRALANLAAHGDSNNNNAAIGQEEGALRALVQLTRSPSNNNVRQEAAGALWNLSFDDRNREAIASAGGVEALVTLARYSSNASTSLQERAAGALWGLSVSESSSVAIGREGGVAPLIFLARSPIVDVHETAAGALWNLAYNTGNALRIVGDGGVGALVHMCSSSPSKNARLMATLALAYIFDGRMYATIDTSHPNNLKSVVASLEVSRQTALRQIAAFLATFFDQQLFSTAAASSSPGALVEVMQLVLIPEAGNLRCSDSEIGRFVAMLLNPSSILKSCATFALIQFTAPQGRHAYHHVQLLKTSTAPRLLRVAAAAASGPLQMKIFAKIVLRNLEQPKPESSSTSLVEVKLS